MKPLTRERLLTLRADIIHRSEMELGEDACATPDEAIEVIDECVARGGEIERLKKMLYLITTDLFFVSQKDTGGPFLTDGLPHDTQGEYEISVNLSDTFFFATADAEPVPPEAYDEVIALVDRYQDEADRQNALTDWAAKRRGYDPEIPRYKKELDEWRVRNLGSPSEGYGLPWPNNAEVD